MTARSQRSLRSSSFMIKAALTGRAARNWSRRLCCRNRKGRDLLAFLETLTSTPTTSRCLFCRDDRGRGASSRRTRRYRSSWAVCAVVATRCSFCSSARPSRSFSDFVEPSTHYHRPGPCCACPYDARLGPNGACPYDTRPGPNDPWPYCARPGPYGSCRYAPCQVGAFEVRAPGIHRPYLSLIPGAQLLVRAVPVVCPLSPASRPPVGAPPCGLRGGAHVSRPACLIQP
jgi:hypothetical protein